MAEAIHFQRVTIHLKEIVAFDAVPLIFTPAEREKAKAE